MKKLYFLIVALFCAFLNIKSQNPTFTWAKGLGGSNAENGYGVAVDGSGNVYSVGRFASTVDFDPGAGVFNMTASGANFDIYISKLDASGNFVWAKRIGAAGIDEAWAIALDGSGNIYTTGRFASTVDFDPNAGVSNLSSAGGNDIFISKLDPAGNFVWAKKIGGTGADIGMSIKIDNAFNVYTTGTFNGTVDFDPGAGVSNITASGSGSAFVSKLDGSGNFVWGQAFIGASEGWGITVDGSSNVYITGAFGGTTDFDPSAGVFNLSASGIYDAFITKLDVSGNLTWAKQLSGSGQDIGTSISLDGSNNVYTGGIFFNTTDFDPGAGTFTMTSLGGNSDAYISKLDVNGNFVMAKQLGGTATGGESIEGIALDAMGNIYTTGYFGGTTDFDPGAGTFTLTSVSSGADIFINKLDASGNFVWAGQIGGVNPNQNTGMDITVDANSNFYVTGMYYTTADFNAGAGIFNMSEVANGDIYVLKYAGCPVLSQPGAISGLNSLCANASATTYSIASIAGATSYTWSLPGGWSGSSATNTISATPGATGIFTVTASNSCGQSPQQTLNVTVNPLPTISVNSGSICSGQTFTMAPSGASTYTFQGGSATVNPSTTTSYTVTGTSAVGCVAASPATSNVTVSATPTIAVNSGSICSGNSFTMVPSGANTYTFQGGSSTVSPTTTTSYTVMGASTAGCVSASPAVSNVTVNALPIIAVNSGSICNGQIFTMTPSGASTYTFQGGSATVSPTTTVSYTVTGTSAAGCVSSSFATSNVTVFTNPTASAGSSQTITCSFPSVPLNGSGVSTYTWNGPGIVSGGNTASPIVNMPGTYSLVGSTSGCNSNTATVNVLTNTIAPSVTAASNSSLICGPPFQGTATLTATGSAATYSWMPSGSGASISVSPSVTTTYTVIATGSNGCTNMSTVTQMVSTCTSINNLTATSELIIYPNPTSGVVMIKAKEDLQINVYNIIGELILSTQLKIDSIELDLSNQANGIYFIRIGSVTRKIIKQ